MAKTVQAPKAADAKAFKNGEEDTEIQAAPPLPTGGELTKAAEAGERSGISSANAMKLLAKAGITPIHAGGSLPLLAFKREGEARLLVYRGIQALEGKTYNMIVWDELDLEKFSAAPNDPSKSFVRKCQQTNSGAFDNWQPQAMNGDIVLVTYGGEIAVKAYESKYKLFAVHSVKLMPRPAANGSQATS